MVEANQLKLGMVITKLGLRRYIVARRFDLDKIAYYSANKSFRKGSIAAHHQLL